MYGLHGQLGFKAYNAVLKYICAKMISNLCSAVQLEQDVNGGTRCQELRFWGVLEELELLRVPELSTNQI